MSLLVERPEADYAVTSFDNLPLDAGFTIAKAYGMAWMSQLAYETFDPRKVERIARAWTIETVDVLHQPARSTLPLSNTHGIIARKGRASIIAFAGTDPVDLLNWISDFYLGRLRSDIHEGFRDAAAAVWDSVGREISRCVTGGDALFIVGHSLGGALALATIDRAHDELGLRNVEAYVFGCPRVGREPFRARFDGSFGSTTYRLVHGDDIVATVPPAEFGFHHVGRLLRCARGGRFHADRLDQRPGSDDPLGNEGVFDGIRHRLAGLFVGAPSPSSRDDILGQMSQLLSPSIGDHLPDRYIAALAP